MLWITFIKEKFRFIKKILTIFWEIGNHEEVESYLQTEYENVEENPSDIREVLQDLTNKSLIRQNPRAKDSIILAAGNSSSLDAKAAVDELVVKVENGWLCKPCGKVSTEKRAILGCTLKCILKAYLLTVISVMSHSGQGKD